MSSSRALPRVRVPRRRVVVLALCAALAVGSPAFGAPTSPAPPPEATTPVTDVSPDDEVTVELPAPLNGRAAVRALGDELDTAAAVNDREPDELRDLLLTDSTTWVDTTGRLLVKDVAPEVHAHVAPEVGADTGTATPTSLADTFRLHSLRGSKRTIFLDFDGGGLANTLWETWDGVNGTYRGWDPAGNGPAFTDDERRLVQQVWAAVAEDYAPYDVDVTTEDPGQAALSRTVSGDEVYGTRVLFSDDPRLPKDIDGKLDDGRTVGIAYVNIFNDVVGSAPVTPALVYTSRLPADPALVADVASHEAGHVLGLEHVDGRRGSRPPTPLYGPIMQSYVTNAPVTQWTTVDVTGLRGGGLALREDEAGSNAATAVPLPASEIEGVITHAADEDWLSLDHCTDVTATATPATHSPNLDIVLRVVDADGTVLASDAPATTLSGGSVVGLGASLSHTASAGHHLVVTGGGDGAGGATQDYDAVGSIGAYTLRVTGCDQSTVLPGPPRNVEAVTSDAGRTTVTWRPPHYSTGTLTAYRITVGGTVVATVAGDAQSHTLHTGAGRTQVAITAVNAAGASRAVSTRSIITPRAAAHVSLLRAPAARRSHPHDRMLRWSGLDDGGSPVIAVDLRQGSLDGRRELNLADAVDWVRRIPKKRDGQKYFIRFHNAAGAGQWTRFRLRLTAVTPRAPRAPSVRLDASGRGLTVAWGAPFDDGGAPVRRYRVRVGQGGWRTVTGRTDLTVTGVRATGQRVRVAAVNRVGRGLVAQTRAVPAGARKPARGRVRSVAPGAPGGPKTLVARWRPGKSVGLPYTGHRLVVQHFDARGRRISTTRTTAYGKKRRAVQVSLPKAGTYRVAVQSRNALGWGQRSAWSRKIRPR